MLCCIVLGWGVVRCHVVLSAACCVFLGLGGCGFSVMCCLISNGIA